MPIAGGLGMFPCGPCGTWLEVVDVLEISVATQPLDHLPSRVVLLHQLFDYVAGYELVDDVLAECEKPSARRGVSFRQYPL